MVRGDSHFATPEVMDLLEEKRCGYIFGLSTNTRSDRTSCHRWEANQFRLFLHMGAYWLLHELRSAAPKRSIWRTATFETIRCTFLKIAVRIQELKTRIKMALPSTYPNVQALTALATSIAACGP